MTKILKKLFRSGSRKSTAALKHLLPGQLDMEYGRLKEKLAEEMPDNPAARGYKIFSQNDEDGIIQEILSRLPDKNKSFIEIGCGDGLQNNTHLLALLGYKGFWVDGGEENIRGIQEKLPAHSRLQVVRRFVDKDNIGALLKEATDFIGTGAIDFFSLDIDGNDLHLAEAALKHITPKVVCVEYNAKFPPPLSFSIRYNPAHSWQSDDYHGASLQAFVDVLKDYQPVCCNLAGVNAFFVHKNYAAHFTAYPVEKLYQKARYRFSHLNYGHPSSFSWLKDALNK